MLISNSLTILNINTYLLKALNHGTWYY